MHRMRLGRKEKMMTDLYWITRFGAISNVLLAIIILTGIALFLLTMAYISTWVEDDKDDSLKLFGGLMKKAFFVFISALICYVFVPTSKEACIIYGVGGTIDYVRSNNTAKKMPDKVIKALDKYLDEQTKEKDDGD